MLVLVAMGVTVRLGFWQVDRYRQNKAFADHLLSMQAASPILLTGEAQPADLIGSAQPADLIGMEYRAVLASGRFDFNHQIAVRNQIWEQTWGNEAGFILVTPLVLPDGSAVLVDRGWIPLKDNTPASWRAYDVPAAVTVNGIIRLPAKPGMGGQPDPTLRPGQTGMDFWNTVNIRRLQTQMPYPLLPVYIQQAASGENAKLPYGSLSTPEETPADTNAGFASMWFGFTALLLFGYPVYLRKQKPVNNGL